MEKPLLDTDVGSTPTTRGGDDGDGDDDGVHLQNGGLLDRVVDFTWTTFDYDIFVPHPFPSNAADALEPPSNYSHPLDGASYRMQVQHCLQQFVIPVILAIGILGNVANLFLLTSDRLYPHRRQTTPMERSAVMGLKTLAASDLLFCLIGFPAPFVKRGTVGSTALISLYYLHHKTAFLNVFLFTSTWLIALVSVERFIAVCHPFRAASLIRVRRTVCAHLAVFLISALLNIPLFMRFSIKSDVCGSGLSCYYALPSNYFTSGFLHWHYIIWFAFGTFTPLVLILGSNALLIRELYHKSSNAVIQRGGSGMGASVSSGSSRSRSINVAQSERTSTLRLTLTLLAVVFCFVVLVCPSMFLQFVKFVDQYRSRDVAGSVEWPSGTEAFLWALHITNLTQAIKFSSNFLLYCAINRTFRQMFARLVRGDSCRMQHEHLQQQQQQVQQQVQQQQQQQQNGGGEMKPPCDAIQMIEK